MIFLGVLSMTGELRLEEKARSLGFARDDGSLDLDNCGLGLDDCGLCLDNGGPGLDNCRLARYNRNWAGRQSWETKRWGIYGVRNLHFVGWLAIFRSKVASGASIASAVAM